MITILQKKRYERALYSRPTIFLLIILIIFLGKAVLNVYEKAQNTNENLELAEVELDTLEARKSLLEDKISTLGTPKGVEAEIRDKFNVVKEGESVIMIVEGEPNGNKDSGWAEKSFWERIKSLFGRD